MIFRIKSRYSSDAQYIGKAQPHCNKDKLINRKYTVQVAVKRKKILPVLFVKQDRVFFTLLVVDNFPPRVAGCISYFQKHRSTFWK